MKTYRVFLVLLVAFLIAVLTACSKEQNGIGQETGEIINLRSAAVQNDWVYHFKRDRNDPESVPGIYKTKLDNSESVLVLEDFGLFLILEDDWIYYSNISLEGDKTSGIYKVKTDGSEKTKLADDSIMSSMSGEGFELDEDRLYYLSLNENSLGGSLYRVKSDGSDKEKLTESNITNFKLKGDWIYYNVLEGGPRIYKMKKDGSENSLIFEEDAMLIDVADDYIYLADESGSNLKRTNLDGTDIKELNIDNIYLLKAKEDWIYYLTQPNFPESDNQLNKAKNDGSDISKLSDDDSFFMEVADDWIYYISMDAENDSYKLNRIKTDGSDKEAFKVKGILVFLNW